MTFFLCDQCESVCNIIIISGKIECTVCGFKKPIPDGAILDDTSYSTDNSSRLDKYKQFGVFDPKVAYNAKKCPKCTNGNYHLCRLVMSNLSVWLKCKNCGYTESSL